MGRSYLLLATLFVSFASCAAPLEQSADPAAPSSTVRFFGSPPALDQSARVGTKNAAQSFTPAPHPKGLKTALRTKWKAHVGKTTPRTTMAVEGGRLYVAGHDAVYVVDAATGEAKGVVRSPDGVLGGASVSGDAIFVAGHEGRVRRLTLAGEPQWTANASGGISAPPALLDVNGDGHVDVLVGTSTGHVAALDGKSGRPLWQTLVGTNGAHGVDGGPALGDVDADGKLEILAGGGDGTLAMLRRDGSLMWQTKVGAYFAAPPVLVDVDGHGSPEVVAATSDGRVVVVEGNAGRILWNAQAENDAGERAVVLGAPVVLPGPRSGVIVVPTAGGTKTEGLLLLGENERRFRSVEGNTPASPVVLKLDPTASPDAIVGTESGDVVAIDATGGRTFLGSYGGPIVASPLVTDVDGDGVRDLLVVTRDGDLFCLATGVSEKPVLDRFRGPHAPINLEWTFTKGRADKKLLDQRLGR